MTFPEIKLVDAPTSTANVLFDFNDTTATPAREVLADDFTIGVPELVGEVDAVHPLYGERVVSFTCRMTGTKPQVAAVQSALARRLLASGQGWLWVRMTATSRLLFFRTYRAQPGDLSFDLIQTVQAGRPERWELEVDLPCEPFAYGERVTQAAQTITNDPSTGTNPMRVALLAVQGDAPTPLRIQVTPSATQDLFRHMVTVNPTAELPVFRQIGTGDTFNPGSDTGAGVADAAFSGGSYRATTFTTAPTLGAGGARLTTTFTNALLPGRYRVMVRVSRSVLAGQFTIQALMGDASSRVQTFPTSTGSASATTSWVDLGVLTAGSAVSPDMTGALPLVNFALLAGRVAGTGDLRWDGLLLVPVSPDGSSIFADFSSGVGPSPTNAGVLDGDAELFWTAAGSVKASLNGTFPSAIPGADHVLTLSTNVSPSFSIANNDVTTSSASVVVSYFPRFLYVGDS